METTRVSTPCPRCASNDTIEVLWVSAPHYSKMICARCRDDRGWAPTSSKLARAAASLMPFGCCRGDSLGKIASTLEGLDYLDWLAGRRASAGALRRDIEVVLAAAPGGPY